MWTADHWRDYELLDCTDGERLERWGHEILIRPDPQVIWHTPRAHKLWHRAHGHYVRSSSGGGHWEKISALPGTWHIAYDRLTFQVHPTNFKHTGLFPEQAVNWDFAAKCIRSRTQQGKSVQVLNLFAYTGGATLACAQSGAAVCHVDAAKGMVAWARENARLSGLSNASVRWISDDCPRFVEREIRRGRRYDAIILDPPSYGRGPKGEIWKLEDNLYSLLQLCADVLSDEPLFVILNSYTTGLAPGVPGYLLRLLIQSRYGGTCEWDEIGLPVTQSGFVLPCGCAGRWYNL